MNHKRWLRTLAFFLLASVMAMAWFAVGASSAAQQAAKPGAKPHPAALSPAASSPAGQAAQSSPAAQAVERKLRVRQPAVAGLFYPAEKTALSEMIDGFLAQAKVEPIENMRALICPHAGYEYSGPTAAFAYKLLVGRDVRTVIILAPSHYADFQGASIPDADAYETPLGFVWLSEKAKSLAKVSPFVLEPRCDVRRPQWWRHSSKLAPATGEDTADTWEHSAEVQVPFLQRTLKSFTILPIIYGRVDPGQAARALADQIDTSTLIVVSTDLSHYYPYDTAKEMDQRCVSAICRMDTEDMKNEEACGKAPVLTLIQIAKQKGWKAKLLDYRNSGDTAGDKSGGVVGYAAIAFYEPSKAIPADPPREDEKKTSAPLQAATKAVQAELTKEEGKFLVALAKMTVREVVTNGKLPKVDPTNLAARLTEPKGCFVTLTENGDLRGCIGHIFPQEPLYKAVIDTAQGAALYDGRFSPVRPEELNKIRVEVSVLTVPQPLDFKSPEDLLAKLQPHKDGVVLRIGARTATYLPQVWEQLPDKESFLSHLSEKAGCAPGAWRERDAEILIYHVAAFKESEK